MIGYVWLVRVGLESGSVMFDTDSDFGWVRIRFGLVGVGVPIVTVVVVVFSLALLNDVPLANLRDRAFSLIWEALI